MVRNAQWGVIATISPDFMSPFGIVQSFADGPGPKDKSSGTPYFYIAKMSTLYLNLKNNNTVSFTLSEAMSDYCEKKGMDPEEPPCGRMIMTGKIVEVTDKDELAVAKDALFTRHPAMKAWPTGHGWTFMKLNLGTVNLLNFYGGMTHIPVKKYLAASG